MQLNHPLLNELDQINPDKYTNQDLIMIHIKSEEQGKKNYIDEYHSLLFRGYHTLKGYQFRYKKIINEEKPYPYGTAVLSVVYIMSKFGNEDLAMNEAKLLCLHPQSILVCEAIIILMKTGNIEKVKEVVKNDKNLLDICNGNVSICRTNFEFLPDWCRHYFLAAVAGFLDDYRKFQDPLSEGRLHTLYLIYCIVHDTFHPQQ